jgi:hypothetical protein
MTTMFITRLLCGLVVLAPVVPALQSTRAVAQGQLAPVQRAPIHEQQQGKINAWTVGLPAGLFEGAPSRLAVETARVVDDGTNLHALPIVRLGTTERLYVRGVFTSELIEAIAGMVRELIPTYKGELRRQDGRFAANDFFPGTRLVRNPVLHPHVDLSAELEPLRTKLAGLVTAPAMAACLRQLDGVRHYPA